MPSASLELALLEVGAGEDELRGADLLDVVEAAFEQHERTLGDDLRLLELSALAVDLGERAEHVAGLGLELRVDEDREGLPELRDRERRRSRADG